MKKQKKKLDHFENIVQDEIPSDSNLIDLFEVYKPLLKSGIYRLFYSPPHSFEVENHFYNSRRLRPFNLNLPDEKNNPKRPSVYLSEGIFMFSQSMDTIDEDRVEYYKEQILKGKNPTIIALGMQPTDESIEDVGSQFTESYLQFIIDGHHKALTYKNINDEKRKNGNPFTLLNPGVFSIVKIQIKKEEESLDENKRQEALSKLLTNKEFFDLVEFYNKWYKMKID